MEHLELYLVEQLEKLQLVSFDVIPALTEAGADVLVGGSGSVFRSGYTYAENCSALREMLSSIH